MPNQEVEIKSYLVIRDLYALGYTDCDDQEAINHAISMGWVIRSIDGYELTDEGLYEYYAASDNPYLSAGYSEWRDEALTGINSIGDPTDIINPVLTNETRQCNPTSIEDYVDKRIALEGTIELIELSLGLDTVDLMDKLKEGSVKLCENGDPHWGEFSRKGSYWHSKCKKCRAKEARDRRSKK